MEKVNQEIKWSLFFLGRVFIISGAILCFYTIIQMQLESEQFLPKILEYLWESPPLLIPSVILIAIGIALNRVSKVL